MASITVTETGTETEATRLVIGVMPAQDAKGTRAGASVPAEAEAPFLFSAAEKEELARIVGMYPPPPPAKQSLFSRLARLWRRYFVRFDPSSIPVHQPLSEEQMEMLARHGLPGYFKQLAMDRELATNCLHHYNINHPGNEYEPAPGRVYQNPHFHNGTCWIHGNFMARKKRSGCFSLFFPAPRTLFFFELAYTNDFNGVLTCTPLDEPVTEAYSVLGFPLWFSGRRSGKLDSYCKTCYRRFDVPHPVTQKIFACGLCMWRKYVKCAIVAPMCCIQTLENSRLAIVIPTAPTLLIPGVIDHCGFEKWLPSTDYIDHCGF